MNDHHAWLHRGGVDELEAPDPVNFGLDRAGIATAQEMITDEPPPVRREAPRKISFLPSRARAETAYDDQTAFDLFDALDEGTLEPSDERVYRPEHPPEIHVVAVREIAEPPSLLAAAASFLAIAVFGSGALYLAAMGASL